MILYTKRKSLRLMPVQSILFKKSFGYSNAVKYLMEHGFVYEKVDETTNYYRFRQFNPQHFAAYARSIGKEARFFTQKSGPIEFVIQYY